MNSSDSEIQNRAIRDRAFKALDSFRIEIPSWGFANTGTRFGKFAQAAAASTIEEKFADAAEVNRLTGVTPTLALHVLWDLPDGVKDVHAVKLLERRFGVRSGSINPNLFQDQEYKWGSLTNRDPAITQALTAFGRAGVPLYLMYPAGGGDPAVLPQILTEGAVVDAAQKEGQADPALHPLGILAQLAAFGPIQPDHVDQFGRTTPADGRSNSSTRSTAVIATRSCPS